MNIFKELLNAIFPKHYACLLCGKEIFDGGDFCTECKPRLTFNDGFTCPVCGRKTQSDGICAECKQQPPLFDKGVSAFVYEDGARELILKFKKDRAFLKEYLGKCMYEKCSAFTDADAVCFVPMTAKAYRNRGYNQAELLAEEISKLLSLPLLKNAIEKVKKSSSQKTLTRAERLNNLHGCFKADREVVKDKTLIVVDDVLTTGATADAVCKELKKRGAKKLYFATVASVEYKLELS
ncbi:MAG: ComF family protein [Candidatus Coproplasma sp.]